MPDIKVDDGEIDVSQIKVSNSIYVPDNYINYFVISIVKR
jgi:hypothetical protein